MAIVAAVLSVESSGTAAEPSWTTLPIPRDARHVERRLIKSEVPHHHQWVRTTFQLKRHYPNADFIADLDKALGPDWRYYGGWPEGWHIYDGDEREIRIRAGNWCNPDVARTIDVVLEYSLSTRPHRAKHDERRQTVTVFEAEQSTPCEHLESGGLKFSAIRPGG